MNSTPPQSPSRSKIDPNRSKGTPRRRKLPAAKRNPGIKKADKTIKQLCQDIKKALKLNFLPEDWQGTIISKIRQGYDSIFLAGTGYGKSIIFEGLAGLGGKGKVTIVISPLKALQEDQVSSPLI